MSIIQYLENGKTEKQPLAGNLYLEIQEDILTGKLKSGTKLTEKKICEDYKVSRTPVREALKQLQAAGLIENIPNRGAFVLGFSDRDIQDMFELQSIYELQCVKYGIERITESELEELTETFEFIEFYTLKNDIMKMININIAFHQILYNATHNRILINIMKTYQTYQRYTNPPDYSAPGYLQEVLEEHRAIYEAFINADVEAGVKAMKIHMENSEQRKLR